jgi:adenylate kinase family enzyme
VKRVVVIASASGSGKTTFSRALAHRLDVPVHELDELHWGPGWSEASAEELRARVEPIVAQDAWVIDGAYMGKLGHLVIERAEVVVWLDLPPWVWLPRLLRRSLRRVRTGEELWHGNQESLRNLFWGRDSLLLFTLRHYRRRRRLYPARLAPYRFVRLRRRGEVEQFLAEASA